jgi:hypothetical protein
MPIFRRKKDKSDRSGLIDRIREKVERAELVGKKIPEPVKEIIRTGVDIAFPRVGKILDAIKALKGDPEVDPLVSAELTEQLEQLLEEEKLLTSRAQNDNEYVITRLVRPVVTMLVSLSAIAAWWMEGLQVAWFKMDIDMFKLMWFEFGLVNVFWFGGRMLRKDLRMGGNR